MLSMQVTLAPEWTSQVQTWEPRNPAPPRTTACLPSKSARPPNDERRKSKECESVKVIRG
jgi:hypothetical protein